MANLALVSALQESKRSVHNKKNDTQRIAEQVIIVKSAIASIVAIVDTQSGSVGDLSKHLLSLSVFFREEKFEKIIVPVLSILQKDDLDKWAIAKIRNTQMPLIPQSFEDLPKSVAEIRYPRC